MRSFFSCTYPSPGASPPREKFTKILVISRELRELVRSPRPRDQSSAEIQSPTKRKNVENLRNITKLLEIFRGKYNELDDRIIGIMSAKYRFIEDMDPSEFNRLAFQKRVKSHFLESAQYGKVAERRGRIVHYVGMELNN